MKKPVGEMTGAELWALFFSISAEPKHRELLKKMIEAKEEIGMAAELLTNTGRDPDERARFISRRRFLMDREHERAVLLDEGKDIMAIEVAKTALQMKMPVEDIIRLTGLPREEIEKLMS